MKPELDYAFLAQFASVENDRLTAVGASFTRLGAEVPSRIQISLASRIRATKDSDDFSVQVRVTSPQDEYDIGVEFMLSPSDAKHPYGPDGRVGMLMAMNLDIPLVSHGLYNVRLLIEDEEVRHLAFMLEPIE